MATTKISDSTNNNIASTAALTPITPAQNQLGTSNQQVTSSDARYKNRRQQDLIQGVGVLDSNQTFPMKSPLLQPKQSDNLPLNNHNMLRPILEDGKFKDGPIISGAMSGVIGDEVDPTMDGRDPNIKPVPQFIEEFPQVLIRQVNAGEEASAGLNMAQQEFHAETIDLIAGDHTPLNSSNWDLPSPTSSRGLSQAIKKTLTPTNLQRVPTKDPTPSHKVNGELLQIVQKQQSQLNNPDPRNSASPPSFVLLQQQNTQHSQSAVLPENSFYKRNPTTAGPNRASERQIQQQNTDVQLISQLQPPQRAETQISNVQISNMAMDASLTYINDGSKFTPNDLKSIITYNGGGNMPQIMQGTSAAQVVIGNYGDLEEDDQLSAAITGNLADEQNGVSKDQDYVLPSQGDDQVIDQTRLDRFGNKIIHTHIFTDKNKLKPHNLHKISFRDEVVQGESLVDTIYVESYKDYNLSTMNSGPTSDSSDEICCSCRCTVF